VSDELSAALRELAKDGATPPVVDGAGIRARATRRRRRRSAAVLGAGAAALVLLGLVLTPVLDGHPDQPARPRIPAAEGTASPDRSVPPSSAAPLPVSGTLSLRERTLTVGGKLLPVRSLFDGRTGFTGSLTVAAKHTTRVQSVDVPSEGPVKVDVPNVVELRDSQDRILYVGTYTKPLSLGGSVTAGDWIGLDDAAAKWFYTSVRLGDRIALTTVTTPPVATPSDRASAAREEPSA
jgi:hypothetical protein